METTIKSNTIDRKEFMKQVGMSIGGIVLLNCLQACSEAEIPDPNPNTNTGKLDFTISLSAMGNTNLNTLGGFVVSTANKTIIARTLDDKFIAVQSDCTHAGTTVEYRPNNKVFFCPNHQSNFKEDGSVVNGPATVALKRYNTSYDKNANTLRVFA